MAAWADTGTVRPKLLLAWSLLAFVVGFAWLAVPIKSTPAVLSVYSLGSLAYGITFTYWIAAFPQLARETAQMQQVRSDFASGQTSAEEFFRQDEKERSKLGSITFCVRSLGQLVILAAVVGIFHVLPPDFDWQLLVIACFTTACWIILSLPWLGSKQERSGMLGAPHSTGRGSVRAAARQLSRATQEVWKLRQTRVYLIGHSLLYVSTAGSALAFLLLAGAPMDGLRNCIFLLLIITAAEAIGIGAFWLIQRRLESTSKTMIVSAALMMVIFELWIMIGNWTPVFGLRRFWELWVASVFFGLFMGPLHSYSQVLISSVTPRGHDNLSGSLFRIAEAGSGCIGMVSVVALMRKGTHVPFYFLFAMSIISAAWFRFTLDPKKIAAEQTPFLLREGEKATTLNNSKA